MAYQEERGRRGEEAGGRMVGLGRRLVVAAGGDANSDNQRRKEKSRKRDGSLGRLGAKKRRGLSSPCNLQGTF